MAESRRDIWNAIRGQLELERSSHIPLWRDLTDYIIPSRANFFMGDARRGDRRNLKIIDSTGTLAARTLRSGMMSGVTSPARPWFKLSTPDKQLAEFGRVKVWLHQVAQIMTTVFLQSNLYNTLPIVYGDLGVLGTAPMIIEEDFDNVIRTESFPVGSYMLGKGAGGKINIFFREFQMTVRQIVEEFVEADPRTGKPDFKNVSDTVKNLWETNKREAWVDVCHIIKPNDLYVVGSGNAKRKRFLSCYYEKSTDKNDVFLRESGYSYFPVLAPRWGLTGNAIYSTDCPGIDCLGDVKQLQLGESKSLKAIDKMIDPPMKGPSTLKTSKPSLLSGDVTYYDNTAGQEGFTPVHETRFDINALENKQQQVRQRIQRAFYEDLFLMLASMDRRQITAREIQERHEEKLLALGPVLEQLNQDLLDPLIEITFEMLLRQSSGDRASPLLPPPPEELQGIPLKVEYISTMAQAQKLVGITGIERFFGFVGNLNAVYPEVRHKVNALEAVDVYADIVSIPPSLVRSDDEVDEILNQQAKAAQAQQQAEMLSQGVGAVKDLGNTPISPDNALGSLLRTANAGNIVPGVA